MTIGGAFSYFFFQLLVPLTFSISVAAFLWGTCLYFIAGSRDEELAEQGKAVMLYGLLSLVVTMVVFGLLSLVRAEV